ncbi:hypothetical protein BGZ83_008107 [Gryganskiella cystojenkinii]|nr:hypothetical protein BGZ83_008107 [Gryganskiella cystojenkinii]
MSSFHTPSSQPNQRFHPQKQHQQNKVYLSQSTKMFKSFSSRFGASTETLPVVETVAQEYARTIKALWRMVEEEELSQRMADARTEDEREQIILEHTQQQLHNQNPYQHQRTSSSSWLLPMHVQTQRTCASSLTATSSSQNKRASHQSGLTTGSRSSMGTYVQPQQNNNKASQDDQRHLQRSKTAPTETLATSVTRHQMQRQQLSRNESLPHRQPHHYSVPPTSSTLVNATCGGQAQNNASYQRRSVPNPVRNSMMLMMSTMRPLSQISDATSSCEDNDDVDDDDDDDGIILSPFSPSSSVYSSEFYVNDMNAKWKKDLKGQPTTLSINQNLKESSLPMLSSSVQQAAQTLQKHDHCTIEERIWMEEDWRLQARLLKSADIPMTPLCSSKKPVLAKKVLRVTQIKNNDAVIDDNDDDNDVDSVIDPDLLSAEYREAFLRRCSNFEPEPKRQDAEADEDERQGARAFCDLEFGRGRFHCGEKYEVEEEDDEIVIAHKIGVRSSRLMQWGTSPGFNATAGGNPAL